MNKFVIGDFRDHPAPEDTSLIIADPVYGTGDIDEIIDKALARKIPACVFMYPEDLCNLRYKPDQICHWIKPVSTKNTVKKYSRFVEVIAMYRVSFYETLHWSNRSGIFTDALLLNEEHTWKKPESLIERLLRNHYPKSGVVYDPFAGSGTVDAVCKRLGIRSFSVEIDERYKK